MSSLSLKYECKLKQVTVNAGLDEAEAGEPSTSGTQVKVKVKSPVVSDSLRPHGLQPTRLLHLWDFPGKSTGVGCHCLLQ